MKVSVIRNVLDWEAAEVFVASQGQPLERLCPPEMRDLSCVEAFVDGTPVVREEWDVPTGPDAEEVVFVLKPQAEFIAGALLFFQVASIAFVARTLFKGAPSASERGNQRSPSYSFGGLENSRIEGLPVQMIYGRHRVGGQIINEWTESLGFPSTTDLFTLIAFGHGRVDRIGDISVDSDDLTGARPETLRIEDNPAENYDDITAWVRMGTTEQTPIPGFHRVYQNLEAAFQLRGKSSNNSADHGDLYVLDPLYGGPDPFNTDWDPAWDVWGETFDVTDASDGVRIKVSFERGLFKAASDGSISSSYFKPQFRYRELDGGNNPIDTGGPNGDGWVRGVPEPMISPNQSEFFERDYDVGPLIDPQTWTVPVPGNMVTATGGSPQSAATISAAATGIVVDAWGVSGWFRLDSALPTSPAAGTEYTIFGNHDATQDTGFIISFKFVAGRWELDARVSGLSSGSPATVIAQTQPPFPGAPTDTGVWRHFAMTYGSLQDGGDDRLRLYQGKNIVAERRSGLGALKANFILSDATTPRAVLCFSNHDYATNNIGSVDDLVLTENEFGQAFVDNRVDGKQTLDENDPQLQLRGRWKYDEAASSGGPAANDILVDGVRWFEDATLTQCDLATGGQVLGAPGGAAKRIKFRLEALRLNYDMNRDDIFDDGTMTRVSHYLDEALSYPTTPLLGLQARATEQLNTTTPRYSVEVRGLVCPFWGGVGAAPTGFAWTANPAWVVADMLTNNDYGLGNRFGFFNLDWDSLYAWALYCDQAVYDGSSTDGPDEGDGWADILFDNSTTGPDPQDPSKTIARGSLEFLYAGGANTPPGHFKIGRFVRPGGVTIVGGGSDINVDDVLVRGYEIIGTPTWDGSAWVVKCYWDRLTETDPWTSGALYTVDSGGPVDGSTTGGHHRFEFNAVFDEERDAWEAILDVCATGRAIPIKEGKQIRIAFNAPLPTSTFADHIIGRGDIVDGSFRIDYSGPQDKPLVYEIEYWDEDELYERQLWRSISPVLTNADESSAEDMRTESIRLFGVTHRAQAERHGNFLHNTNTLVKRVGEFRVAPSALRVEPGDVALIAHDILPRGVSGRASGTGNPHQVIVSDAFTIKAETTYNVYVRDYNSDVVEKRVLDTAITGPNDYPDGGTLEVTADFTMRPAERLSSYVLVEDGQELRVRVTETTLDEELEMVVRWGEYSDALYADDAIQTETTSDFFGPGSGNVNTPDEGPVGTDRPNDKTLPAGPTAMRVSERMLADAGPGRGTEIVLAWTWPAGEQARIASVRIFARPIPVELTAVGSSVAEPDSAWVLAGEVDGQRLGATVSLPFAAVPGETVQLALQGVTLGGTRRRPSRCPVVPYSIVGAYRGPEALSGAGAEMDGGRVRYSWDQPDRRGLQAEIRRGGWILGQPVTDTPADGGRSPHLEDWAGSVSGLEFPLLFASRDSSGQYSGRTTLAFTPSPDVLGAFSTDLNASQAWEDYADGWKTDSLPPIGDPLLTDLQRHADGYLEFAGSATTGTYETWNPQAGPHTLRRALVPHDTFVEVSVEAEAVDPLTWEGATWAWGDPRYSRWAWEGPAWTVGSESGASLIVEWRFTKDGTTWEDWSLFRPGAYRIVDFQPRLVVTRPDSTYQVRIHRLHTQARLIRSSAVERDRVTAYIQREAF